MAFPRLNSVLEAARSRLTRISERPSPDGPLAHYRWMWRALCRSSDSALEPWVRLVAHVVTDAALLCAWTMGRWARRLRPVRSQVMIAATLTLLIVPLSVDLSPDPGAIEIVLQEGGIVVLEGRTVPVADVPALLLERRVESARVRVDHQTPYAEVQAFSEAATRGGVSHAIYEMEGPPRTIRR